MVIKWRDQNDGRNAEFSDLSVHVCSGESLTVQSMAEDADINVLMHRFGITGKMPENVRLPQYGDWSHVTDYRSAIHAVREAEEEFMKIPARARAAFGNDPQALLDFAANGGNMEQLKSLAALEKANVGPVPVQQVNSNVGGASGAPEVAARGDGAAAGAGAKGSGVVGS